MNINLKIEAKRDFPPTTMKEWVSKTDKDISLLHCYKSTLDFFEKYRALEFKVIKVSKRERQGRL